MIRAIKYDNIRLNKSLKILNHTIIWLILFLIESLVYWKGNYWNIDSFTTAMACNGILFPIKIMGVYLFINQILSLWNKPNTNWFGNLFVLLVFLGVWLIVYRIIINYVCWPIVFDHFPGFNPFDVRLSSYSFLKLLTPLAFILPINFIHSKIEFQRKLETIEKEKLAAEVRFLKAQTNPHFLFNTLNTIYALAKTNSKHTAGAIAKMSRILRYLLYDSDHHLIPVIEEVNLIHDYLDLIAIRMGSEVGISISTQIENESMQIPPFVLMTFVENACKYSRSESENQAFISMKLTQHASSLNFEIVNSFSRKAENNTQGGIGIKNALSRLDLYFPDNYTYSHSTSENCYSVVLKINSHYAA